MRRELAINLLHNLGAKDEVEKYLRQYAGEGGSRFSVIKVGGGLVEEELNELASALALLQQLGVTPVVVHGAGPQLTTAMAAEGIEPDWVDGLRVTTPQVLTLARRVFQRVGATLADAIEQRGGRARPLPSGVFEASPSERPELGHVGDVARIDREPIEQAIAAGYIPVLAPLGATQTGQMLNVNGDNAARAAAHALGAQKIVFLTPTGGILDGAGQVIPAVNLDDDLERMIENGAVSGGMARKLAEIDKLLEGLGPHASVSVTSPSHLALELFTHRGGGTLVRRGIPIREVSSGEAIDQRRVSELLAESFGRAPAPWFLDTIDDARVYLGGDYAGIAVVRERDTGDYLDKFAVTARAQGVGLGASLWRRICNEHGRLYWRSRPSNDANAWYLSRADGMHRGPEWLVFWRGIESRADIEACVADALAQPITFSSVERSQEVAQHAV